MTRPRPPSTSRKAPLARAVAIILAMTALAAQARPSVPEGGGDALLKDARGTTVPLARLLGAHRLTVVVFYSATCPCFAAHIGRLQRLAAELGPQGVGFVVVDSERRTADDAAPPLRVAPALPLFRDEDGLLARHLGALYATETFVVDDRGNVRYRGGIDSDRKYLRIDARAYLRDAVVGLLAGKDPAFANSKALGCALKLR